MLISVEVPDPIAHSLRLDGPQPMSDARTIL